MKTITKTYLRFDKKDEKEFKKWLVDNELSQNAFAKRCKTTCAYINAIVRGKKNLTKHTIEIFKKGGYLIKV